MEEFTKAYRYDQAKKKVDQLRGFYIHFFVYIIANTIISALKVNRNLNNGETLNEAIFDFATIGLWVIWGVAILFHAFAVFGFDFIFGRHWEAKKLKKFMAEEEEFLKQQDNE